MFDEDFSFRYGFLSRDVWMGFSHSWVPLIRLYQYKFIINGQWRHSTVSPTETDESGNINNVIILGSKASVRPSFQPQPKDSAVVKVIERPLTEYERVMLAKAARCIAFSICPIRLAPK
ncbi:hypothetical protein Scep_030859 [Stephania cephalantha]|uniref:AMP-activated protein kinase glycogen-binding domain-containing protein n=1 Tax=Stephania cephalantha TaxID=152367 RepID=A0AAP0HDI8_9MAGN